MFASPNSTNTTNDNDDPGVAADILPASFGLLCVLYIVAMFLSNRSRLYHVWNHLTIIMFTTHIFRLIFFIAFIATTTPHVSCAFATTLTDACRSVSTIAMTLMFCVMMVPVCFEPERRKIFVHELFIFGSLLLFIVLQIGLYIGSGRFTTNNPRLCHLRLDQVALLTVFEWIPDFLNVLLNIYFIYWVRSRNTMLSRRRINVFAYILLLGSLAKAVGAIIEIHASINQRKHLPEHGLTSSMIIFLTSMIYTVHLLVYSIAFAYAEDLVPHRVREFCACCCDGVGGRNNGEGNPMLGESSDDAAIRVSSQSSLNASPSGGEARSTSPSPNYNNNNNNNNNNNHTAGESYGATNNNTNNISPNSNRSSARTSSKGTRQQLAAMRYLQQQQELVTHTLTYFLQMNRDDIVASEKNIPSINIRSSMYESASQTGSGGGIGGDNNKDYDDDVVSRSSAHFHASTPYFPPHLDSSKGGAGLKQ